MASLRARRRSRIARAATRIVVALRDWGPLALQDIQDDAEVTQGMAWACLKLLSAAGWVRYRKGRGWEARPKALATSGGLRWFGYKPGGER